MHESKTKYHARRLYRKSKHVGKTHGKQPHSMTSTLPFQLLSIVDTMHTGRYQPTGESQGEIIQLEDIARPIQSCQISFWGGAKKIKTNGNSRQIDLKERSKKINQNWSNEKNAKLGQDITKKCGGNTVENETHRLSKL